MDEGAPHSEGEAQAGGPQAGGMQAGGPQAGGLQAGGLQAGGLQAGGQQAGGLQVGGQQAGGLQAGGLQAGGPQAGGSCRPSGRGRWAWSFTARAGGANCAATVVGACCGAAAVGASAARGASVRLTLGWASAPLVCVAAGRHRDSLLRGTSKFKSKTPCKQTENLTNIDLTFIEHAIQ